MQLESLTSVPWPNSGDIGGVVRYKAVEWAEHLDSQSEKAISSSSVNKESGLLLKRRLGKVYLCGEEILFCWRVVYDFMNRCFLLFFLSLLL